MQTESCMLMGRWPWSAHLQEHSPMRPEFVVSIRFLRCFAVATLLALIFNCEVVRAQAKTSATPGNPKIRAITAFINLDRPRYQQVVVAGEDGVRWNAVGAAARVMKKLEETTEHSQGNFRFAAIAMVPPLTPFFPAAYHTGFGHQFAIALESANLVAAAFKDSRDLGMARQRLIDSLAAIAFDVEGHAGRVDQETGWTYMGIDLSPAPSGDV